MNYITSGITSYTDTHALLSFLRAERTVLIEEREAKKTNKSSRNKLSGEIKAVSNFILLLECKQYQIQMFGSVEINEGAYVP